MVSGRLPTSPGTWHHKQFFNRMYQIPATLPAGISTYFPYNKARKRVVISQGETMEPHPLTMQEGMKRYHGHVFLAPEKLYFVCAKKGGAWAAAIGTLPVGA